jgi:hypothetical protein
MGGAERVSLGSEVDQAAEASRMSGSEGDRLGSDRFAYAGAALAKR